MDIKNILKDVFNLDKLILATLLLWIYRILICVVIVGGLFSGLATMFNVSFFQGLATIVIGIPLGVLIVRIWIELIYLIVAIHEKLREIRDSLNAKKAE